MTDFTEQLHLFNKATGHNWGEDNAAPAPARPSIWDAPKPTSAPTTGGPSSVPWCNNMPTEGQRKVCEADAPLEEDPAGNFVAGLPFAVAGGLVGGAKDVIGHLMFDYFNHLSD